jgi:hypothetical protein
VSAHFLTAFCGAERGRTIDLAGILRDDRVQRLEDSRNHYNIKLVAWKKEVERAMAVCNRAEEQLRQAREQYNNLLLQLPEAE